jgi:DNA mismatch endonuclease (patch repair protein)
VKDQWVSTDAAARLRGRKQRETEPELLLRRALHAAGARFRLHRRLAPGCTPDLVLPGRRLAVWVDAKIARNQARDERATQTARKLGWAVVRVWECEIRRNPADAAARVFRLVPPLNSHDGPCTDRAASAG